MRETFYECDLTEPRVSRIIQTFPHATGEIAARVAAEFFELGMDKIEVAATERREVERAYAQANWCWKRSKELAA